MSFCVDTLQPTRKGYRSLPTKTKAPGSDSGGPRQRQAVILPHTDANVKGRGLSPKARAALGARRSGGALRIQPPDHAQPVADGSAHHAAGMRQPGVKRHLGPESARTNASESYTASQALPRKGRVCPLERPAS